jgi:hypothetical protein
MVADECCRCLWGGHTKLIGARICPSCHARGIEFKNGRNAKGTAPRFAVPVAPLAIRFSIDGGEPKVWAVSQAADFTELALDLLRRGRLVFLPAEGEALPAELPANGPVIFRRVRLDPPIAGESWGITGVDNHAWKPPLGKKPARTSITVGSAASAPKPKPAATPTQRELNEQVWPLIEEMRSAGMSYSECAAAMNESGVAPRADSRPWSLGSVAHLVQARSPAPAAAPEPKAPMVIRRVSTLAPIAERNALAMASTYAVCIEAGRELLAA